MSSTSVHLSPEAAAALAGTPYLGPDTFGPIKHTTHRAWSGIEYARVLGHRPLLMELLIPNGPGPYPVVVYFHAGAWVIGSNREHDPNAPTRMIWDGLLAAGIAVASVQYRFSGEATFPACFHDAVAAVRWLRRFAPQLCLRADAIGAWGSSAGGFLAAFLGMNVGDPALLGDEGVGDEGGCAGVQAAVAWYAPSDLTTKQGQALPDFPLQHDTADSPDSLLIGQAIKDDLDLARWASPRTYVSGGAAPFWIVQGENDPIVPPGQSRELHASLLEAGVESHLTLVPGAGHLLRPRDPSEQVRESIEFLGRALQAVPVAKPRAALR